MTKLDERCITCPHNHSLNASNVPNTFQLTVLPSPGLDLIPFSLISIHVEAIIVHAGKKQA